MFRMLVESMLFKVPNHNPDPDHNHFPQTPPVLLISSSQGGGASFPKDIYQAVVCVRLGWGLWYRGDQQEIHQAFAQTYI